MTGELKTVIVRDTSGIVKVKQSSAMGLVETAIGLLSGSVIGLFGGAVGVAFGAVAGTFAGWLYDLAHLGLCQDFLEDVGGKENLSPFLRTRPLPRKATRITGYVLGYLMFTGS